MEAVTNTAFGFAVSYWIGLMVYPMFGFNVAPHENVAIVSIFTVASVLRSYVFRRIFNYLDSGMKNIHHYRHVIDQAIEFEEIAIKAMAVGVPEEEFNRWVSMYHTSQVDTNDLLKRRLDIFIMEGK